MIVLLLFLQRIIADMERLFSNLTITVHPKIYLKDPESSDLGLRIIEHSILLIDEIGFEALTFKKLGQRIGSNESSIYRYFENKHKLLLYLTNWYWGWLEYKLVMETYSMTQPQEKLKQALEVITRPVQIDASFSHIDEVKLGQIVVNEFSKSYLTKEVDDENKEGYFAIYKRLIHRVRDMILEACPEYQHPASLSSTVVDGALHQHFLMDHFTSITDCKKSSPPSVFFKQLVLSTLKIDA